MIEYRSLSKPLEFAAVCDMEQTVWGMDPAQVIAVHTQHVIVHTGGCIIGAFDDERMIGVVVGFATNGDRLWSHFAAVLPDYQRQGIGYQLKHEQRRWALAQGYKRISWTFDPLQSLNANFNLNRLGVRANVYHVNFYGEMTDAINAGMQSDRLEVNWFLQEEKAATPPHTNAPFLLNERDGQPVTAPMPDPAPDVLRVSIPRNINDIKVQDMARARAWQAALRAALQRCFALGYQIVDFSREVDSCYYILKK